MSVARLSGLEFFCVPDPRVTLAALVHPGLNSAAATRLADAEVEDASFEWAMNRDVPESPIFQYRFSVNRDLDGVADDDAAFVHGVVPTDAKVLPVD